MRAWAVVLVAVVATVLAAAIAVVVLVLGSGDTSVVDLVAGDCFELPDTGDGAFEAVSTVDCDEPHLAEVVAVGDLGADDEPYPDDGVLFAEVERRCREAGAVASDDFGLLPIAPSPELWRSFDGRYVCVAIPYGGVPVTGSVRTD